MENNVNIEELRKQVIDEINKQFEAVDATIDEQYDKYAAVLADISETAGFTCEGSKAARKAILSGDLILALDETNVHHLVVTLK